ncbi:hypothetical protein ACLUWA_08520, partial [Bifidobacterium thermophilum]
MKVSDVGAHTADVSFDWDLSYLLNGKQSGSYKDQSGYDRDWKVDYMGGDGDSSYAASVDPAKDIDGVCFVITVRRTTSVVPHDGGAWGPSYPSCGDSDYTSPDSSVADDKMTPEDYQRCFGMYTDWLSSYQEWDRFYNVSLAEAGAKPGTLKGHYDMALIGLDANTVYGNRGVDFSTDDWGAYDAWMSSVFNASSNLYKKGVRKATKVDIRSLRLGVAVRLKDSSKAVQQCKANKDVTNKSACNTVFPYINGVSEEGNFAIAAVPDFRTGVEPVVPSSVSGLPASVKGGVSVDAGVVKQGSVARFYVDGLKAAARGKADASSLFWYAYIYSSPQRLTGPDGAPYVTVKKAADGRYYFDAIVPAGLKAGSHTVSLTDANGTCQGWTPVTVTAASTA